MPASTHPLVADTLPRHSFYLTPGNPSLGHIMAPNDFHQLFFPSDNKHDRLRGYVLKFEGLGLEQFVLRCKVGKLSLV